MKSRRRLDAQEVPEFWLDWRIVVKDIPLVMRAALRVVQDTLLFDKVMKNIPVNKRVLQWLRRNRLYVFKVIVIGANTGCLDQMLSKRLKMYWINSVYYAESMQDVLDEMKQRPWVVGYLTADATLVGEDNHVFKFESNMNMANLSIM